MAASVSGQRIINYGKRLKFSVLGNGPNNIIFLHGWGADHRSFLWIENYLQNATLHFADLDGFGGTPPPEDPTVVGYCERLKQYIEQNNIPNVILVGHSFGGRVAIEYASKYSLKGLVLVDSAGVKPKFNIKRFSKVMHFKLCKKLVKLKLASPAKLQKFGSSDYNACDGKLRRVMVSAVNYDQTKLLHKITCPTLIVWGSEDRDTPMYMAKKLNKKIKNSGLTIIKGGGHFSFLNNPYVFAKTIDYFVNNI